MSEKEQAKMIIDRLPDYKLPGLLLFLQGMQFSDELTELRLQNRLQSSFTSSRHPIKSGY